MMYSLFGQSMTFYPFHYQLKVTGIHQSFHIQICICQLIDRFLHVDTQMFLHIRLSLTFCKSLLLFLQSYLSVQDHFWFDLSNFGTVSNHRQMLQTSVKTAFVSWNTTFSDVRSLKTWQTSDDPKINVINLTFSWIKWYKNHCNINKEDIRHSIIYN